MIEVGSQAPYGSLKILVGALIVLNMLDGVLTIGWIQSGRAVEANPLMDILLGIHPVLFMLIKLLLVCLGVSLLWRLRTNTTAVFSIHLCFIAYSFIFLYHVGGGVIQLI